MRKIKLGHIIAATLCLVAFVVFLIMGFYRWFFFLPALCAIAGYIFIDRKYLRCPCCGAFVNIDHLFRASSGINYCYHCGERIEVEKHFR